MEPNYYEIITSLAAPFDSDEEIVECVHLEVGGELQRDGEREILPRLLRAAINQSCSDPAAFTCYRIWAETLRGCLIGILNRADATLDIGQRRNLTRVVNSLGAFCQIQDFLGRE